MCDYGKVKPVMRSRTHPMDDGDRIYISGVAGQFPNSDNILEFGQNLYNKVKCAIVKCLWVRLMASNLCRWT